MTSENICHEQSKLSAIFTSYNTYKFLKWLKTESKLDQALHSRLKRENQYANHNESGSWRVPAMALHNIKVICFPRQKNERLAAHVTKSERIEWS